MFCLGNLLLNLVNGIIMGVRIGIILACCGGRMIVLPDTVGVHSS
jgi:hypothetical protein